MSRAYYNEIDPKAAAWLRELVARGLIAPGDVDERDIRDIEPRELMGYTQCHFFAGIGTWSFALRRAGWADDRQVWTGSCPCQPFSAAGRKRGTSDERHLWPHWFHLIRVCKPGAVFGEQVASKDGITWLDTVSADLEGEGYSCGPVVFPACGVGAPHKRDRLWFVADSNGKPGEWRTRSLSRAQAAEYREGREDGREPDGHSDGSEAGSMADTNGERQQGIGLPVQPGESRQAGSEAGRDREISDLGDPHRQGRQGRQGERCDDGEELASAERAGGPVGGFWGNAEWIWCRDEKYRAVEPGSFPLAHGIAHRVGRLRGYGNGIVEPVAEEIIKAYLEQIG